MKPVGVCDKDTDHSCGEFFYSSRIAGSNGCEETRITLFVEASIVCLFLFAYVDVSMCVYVHISHLFLFYTCVLGAVILYMELAMLFIYLCNKIEYIYVEIYAGVRKSDNDIIVNKISF